MSEKKFYLTKQGLENIKKEYEKLKSLRKEKVSEETPQALHSEELDTEFVAYREDMEFLEARLADIEVILKHVEIIKPKKKDVVDLGARVKLVINNQEDEFFIVGTLEANPNLGKISNESPVGRALMGHKVGDEVKMSSPKETIYKIKSVKY